MDIVLSNSASVERRTIYFPGTSTIEYLVDPKISFGFILMDMWTQEGWTPPGRFDYLKIGLGFILLEQGFEIYLSLRQRKHLKKTTLPADLVSQVQVVDESRSVPKVQSMERDSEEEEPKTFLSQMKSKFTKSQAYNLDRNSFSFFRMGYNLTISVGMLVSGFQVWMWDKSTQISTEVLGFESSNEIAVSMVFLCIGSIVGIVTQLPASLYSTFSIEQKHGFNKMTPWLFVSDTIKNFFIENLLTLPLMAAIISLVRWGGEHFWIYVWGLIVVFSLVMLTIYPNYIMPLFNEYKPLPEGALKTAIEKLAGSLKFPLTKLYEVDGSKRSSHSNAYLFGFLKDKRIVLFDTLIKNREEPALECSTEEIVAILGHELGHWQLNHTVKGFLVQNLLILLGLKGFSMFLHDSDMYSSFGFTDHAVVIGLNLFSHIMSPLGSVLGFCLNATTRKFEFEADAFAVDLGKGSELKAGLLKISISNLASFDVDPLFHMFHHSHPTILERLRTMDARMSAIDKRSN